MTLALLSIACLFGVATTLPWDGPVRSRSADDLALKGRSPMLTAVPDGFEQWKREDIRTCGYEAGNPMYPITCNPGYFCSTVNSVGVVQCCPAGASSCDFTTSCVAKSLVLPSCNTDCAANSRIIKCNNDYPFCITFLFDFGSTTLSNLGCQNSIFTRTVYPTTTNSPTQSFPSSLTSSETVTSGSGTLTVTIPAPTSLFPSMAPTPTQTDTQPGTGPPPGVIAGSVIAGLVVISLVILGVVYMLRNRPGIDGDSSGPNRPSPMESGNKTHTVAPTPQELGAEVTPIFGQQQTGANGRIHEVP